MFHLIKVVFHPLLAFRFDLLKGVELNFVLRRVDVLLFDVVLFGKAIEPESAPDITHVSYHGERTCFKSDLLA